MINIIKVFYSGTKKKYDYMGAKGVRVASSQAELNEFTGFLLNDIQAMEKMLEDNWFEDDLMHIGAEQEICLVDEQGKPAPKSVEILKKLNHRSFTTELARFNLEANLDPLPFTGSCFSEMEKSIVELMSILHETAKEFDVAPILTGILPTIRKYDLGIENLTPIDRYYALIEAINTFRGGSHELIIEGIDELKIKDTSALIEACNTSFQVHLQIKPNEFVNKYNIAQAIAAPTLALATNSPMLFGKKLWNETRIALFQQSIDTRKTGDHLRFSSPRVMFGNGWLKDSILELYKEDIGRFKVMLMTDVEENVMEMIKNGKTPSLKALSIHNSTVYRWNRACYGVSPSGKPHLRIENRVLPAGPTITDEIANFMFWVGIMNGFEEAYPNVAQQMDFDDAKNNFLKACKLGLGARYKWVNGSIINDNELIEKELLPIAKKGLENAKISSTDIDKYLGIIEERNHLGQTGARWILDSYSKLRKESSKEESKTALVAGIIKRQKEGMPVHNWDLASVNDIADWEPTALLVEEFMTTDLFTVSKEDIPEFAASMLDWQKIRYIPIENDKGELIGLITSRQLLKHFNEECKHGNTKGKLIKDLMLNKPIVISPEATVIEAMELMRSNKIGCLPVVNNNKLVGIITEGNFLNITNSLFKRLATKKKKRNGDPK